MFGCRRPRHPVWPDVHLFETGEGRERERETGGRTEIVIFALPRLPFSHPSSSNTPLLLVVFLAEVLDVELFFFLVVLPLALDRRLHSAVERALRHVLLAVAPLLLDRLALLLVVVMIMAWVGGADEVGVMVSKLPGIWLAAPFPERRRQW